MVYVFLADGFEEVEALTAVDVLRRAGVDVKTVSIQEGPVVPGAHGIDVHADLMFSNCNFNEANMLVLPGGLPGSTNLLAHQGLKEQLLDFAEKGKNIAAICAAPMVLGAHGILKGKKATIYPGIEDKLIGAIPTGEAVTVDGNIITGMGPAKAMEFALALLMQLKGENIRNQIAAELLY